MCYDVRFNKEIKSCSSIYFPLRPCIYTLYVFPGILFTWTYLLCKRRMCSAISCFLQSSARRNNTVKPYRREGLHDKMHTDIREFCLLSVGCASLSLSFILPPRKTNNKHDKKDPSMSQSVENRTCKFCSAKRCLMEEQDWRAKSHRTLQIK